MSSSSTVDFVWAQRADVTDPNLRKQGLGTLNEKVDYPFGMLPLSYIWMQFMGDCGLLEAEQ